MSLQITSARYFFNDGRPTLELTVNGKRVLLDRDNRNSLFSEDGCISLGPAFDDDSATPVIQLAAKPETGRPSMTLHGFTTDSRVLELFRRYVSDVDGKKFTERQIQLNSVN